MTNLKLYNLSKFLYIKKIPFLPKLFNRLLRIIYSCEIPNSVKIGKNVVFSHKGLGVVIGHDTEIGDNCKILQNVTIGGRSGIRANPKIGNSVLIGAGAIILGDITIGDNAKIGAGAVVIKSVAEGQTVVGNPAKPINNEIR
ncbi:serine O-acetyltransferase [Enterococcus casseliflavus]|uniref:serine O-acetyltransferase n=1 Tax=Enterococcus casseliflavus TaxID=37734 RepID=UPI003D12DEA5